MLHDFFLSLLINLRGLSSLRTRHRGVRLAFESAHMFLHTFLREINTNCTLGTLLWKVPYSLLRDGLGPGPLVAPASHLGCAKAVQHFHGFNLEARPASNLMCLRPRPEAEAVPGLSVDTNNLSLPDILFLFSTKCDNQEYVPRMENDLGPTVPLQGIALSFARSRVMSFSVRVYS